MSISFFVPGIPAPGGSKRFVGFGKHTKRAILIDAAGQRNKDWRNAVAFAASESMQGRELFDCAVSVTMLFLMPRPKGHYNSKGELRASAPKHPTKKPDVLKLARSTEDAMTGIVWRDDASTVRLNLRKHYTTGQAGCEISVEATL